MFDVRKFFGRAALVVVGGLLAGVAAAQTATTHRPAARRPRHETNASRQARIQRTIEQTYAYRWDVFGGGGYLRFKSGDHTQKNNEVSWAAAAEYNLNNKWAVVGDVRGSFGNAHQIASLPYPQIARPQINEYTFMGGANYRFYKDQKFSVSGQVLGGVAWGIFSGGSKGLPSTDLGLWPDSTRAAFSVGVPLDYNFFPNFAVRIVPTYLGTTFGGGVQNNVGFNAGVLYRFGK